MAKTRITKVHAPDWCKNKMVRTHNGGKLRTMHVCTKAAGHRGHCMCACGYKYARPVPKPPVLSVSALCVLGSMGGGEGARVFKALAKLDTNPRIVQQWCRMLAKELDREDARCRKDPRYGNIG